ncbi:MAG: LysM peptidoglycan-binding domain-containing protein [Anaerolineae bacterium]|nr:LysM peptidoglycan-binding domain-containing protein [Anaerolineae bacterium]
MRRLLPLMLLLVLLATAVSPASASGTVEHIVDRGETLSSIARHYHTSVPAILAANPSIWNPNVLWAGMRLQIPTGDHQPPPPPPTHPGGGCSWYVVRYGDTLTGIAAWYGVSPWAIAQLNGIYNLNHIYAGMYLQIPCGGSPDPHPCPYGGCMATTSYTVQYGDNLTLIAARYGVTVEAILAANAATIPYGNYIQPGQVIQIPVG